MLYRLSQPGSPSFFLFIRGWVYTVFKYSEILVMYSVNMCKTWPDLFPVGVSVVWLSCAMDRASRRPCLLCRWVPMSAFPFSAKCHEFLACPACTSFLYKLCGTPSQQAFPPPITALGCRERFFLWPGRAFGTSFLDLVSQPVGLPPSPLAAASSFPLVTRSFPCSVSKHHRGLGSVVTPLSSWKVLLGEQTWRFSICNPPRAQGSSTGRIA